MLSVQADEDAAKILYGAEAWAQNMKKVDAIVKIDGLQDYCVYGFLGTAPQRKLIADKKVQLMTAERFLAGGKDSAAADGVGAPPVAKGAVAGKAAVPKKGAKGAAAATGV